MLCFRKTANTGFTTAAQPNAGFASCYGQSYGLTDRH